MRALVLQPELRTASVADVPGPRPSKHEVIVQIHAVSLNPVDALYTFEPLAAVATEQDAPRIVGSDFAGVIIEKGPDVPHTVKLGDRVAGFLQGAASVNFRPGAFAQQVTVPYDLLWQIPSTMSFDDASTISLCGLTAAFALFGSNRLGLTAPWKKDSEIMSNSGLRRETSDNPRTILIYGASTSVAIFAAQLLQHTKEQFNLIGLASPKHFQWLKEKPYSYDHLIDYQRNWIDKVGELQKGPGIDLAFDCISEGSTVQSICQLMHPDGRVAVVRSIEGGAWRALENTHLRPSYGAVWEGLGEDVVYKGMDLPANPEARAFATDFYRWLSAGDGVRIRPQAVRLMPGGLDRIVEDGFGLLGSGLMTDRTVDRDETWMRPISAEKLVYHIE